MLFRNKKGDSSQNIPATNYRIFFLELWRCSWYGGYEETPFYIIFVEVARVMLPWFVFIFVLSFLFYGSLFAALGAAQGSESDGQKFLIPIFFLFILALFSGYYCINYPESNLSTFFGYFPITAPMALMVKIAIGIQDQDYWHFVFSLLTLVLS